MNFTVDEIISAPAMFVGAIRGLPEGDICSIIARWTLVDMTKLSAASDDLIETIATALPDKALDLLMSKVSPTGVRFNPGTKSKFALVSVTNMRWRACFQMVLVAMISFLYRALAERSKADSCEHFNRYYNAEQSALIKGFLDDLFRYDPSESIDRYTSELYTPAESKTAKSKAKANNAPKKNVVKAETATIIAHQLPTRIKDRSKSYSADVNKWSDVERSAAEIHFDTKAADGTSPDITVVVDPPADIYGHFNKYFETHFDAINKVWVELFLEGRAYESITRDQAYIYEKVQVYERKPGDKTAHLISALTLPCPSAQWHESVTVFSPPDGAFFDDERSAEEELNRHKGTTVADLRIIPTNATVLTGAWYAGKRRIITDDATTQALFKKLENDAKVYQQLNKKRVEDAKFREIVQQGADPEGFENYMRELNPNYSNSALDKQDMEEIMARYRDYIGREQIYSNSDRDFITYVSKMMPNRKLDTEPLSLDERKKWSSIYRNGTDVPELPNNTDLMAIDLLELGDPEHPAPQFRREYVNGMETPLA
jgi:hypothetical protein